MAGNEKSRNFASKLHKMEKQKYTYDYPHPAVATDCVVFGFDGRELRVLLIERGIEPYKGAWALPGGFIRMDETAEQTALRELQEETGLSLTYLKQFKAFGSILAVDCRPKCQHIPYCPLVGSSQGLLYKKPRALKRRVQKRFGFFKPVEPCIG